MARWSTSHDDDGYYEKMRLERQLEEQKDEQRRHNLQADHRMQELRASGERWAEESAESAIDDCVTICQEVYSTLTMSSKLVDRQAAVGAKKCIEALEELE